MLAEALVRAANNGHLTLHAPTAVREEPGQGIEGHVGGRTIAVGSRRFLSEAGVPGDEVGIRDLEHRPRFGEAKVLVALDGHLAGVIVMADEPRPEAAMIVPRLHAEGVKQIALVSGDRRSVAERIGHDLGVDRVYAELLA